MRVCSATSSRTHLSGASKTVRRRYAPNRSSLQTTESSSPASRTPAAAHPRRRMSSTANMSAALALPRSDAICSRASCAGTVVTVSFAPPRLDQRVHGVPSQGLLRKARTRRRVPRRAAGAAPRQACCRRSRQRLELTTTRNPGAHGSFRAAGVRRAAIRTMSNHRITLSDQAGRGERSPSRRYGRLSGPRRCRQ